MDALRGTVAGMSLTDRILEETKTPEQRAATAKLMRAAAVAAREVAPLLERAAIMVEREAPEEKARETFAAIEEVALRMEKLAAETLHGE